MNTRIRGIVVGYDGAHPDVEVASHVLYGVPGQMIAEFGEGAAPSSSGPADTAGSSACSSGRSAAP